MLTRLLRPILLACGLAAAEPTAVPKEVAATLTKVQELEDSAERLRLLDAHQGEDHPLLHLVRGQCELQLAQAGAEAAAHRTAALAAFRAAVERDPDLRQAHLGIAQACALGDDWAGTVTACARLVALGEANEHELLLYANAAWQVRDWRLTQILIAQGITRFPAHEGFRRLELAALVEGGRADEAHQAVLALLATHPDDTDLWRHLAWSAQQTGDEVRSLAALEIAVLQKPDDAGLRERLARIQLIRGMARAAQQTIAPLLGDPATVSDAVLDLAVRAAADGGDLKQARAWLAARPEDRRTRDQRLLAARLALRADDRPAAVAAVKSLVALGEADPQVLAWAGQVCEDAGDEAAAEAFYGQAAGSDHAVAGAATLRLASLFLRQERRQDAESLLAAHLAQHPQDAQARALQARISAAPR